MDVEIRQIDNFKVSKVKKFLTLVICNVVFSY